MRIRGDCHGAARLSLAHERAVTDASWPCPAVPTRSARWRHPCAVWSAPGAPGETAGSRAGASVVPVGGMCCASTHATCTAMLAEVQARHQGRPPEPREDAWERRRMPSRKVMNGNGDDRLTPQQQTGGTPVSGKTLTDAAGPGVTRETVSGWVNHHPSLAALNARRQEGLTAWSTPYAGSCPGPWRCCRRRWRARTLTGRARGAEVLWSRRWPGAASARPRSRPWSRTCASGTLRAPARRSPRPMWPSPSAPEQRLLPGGADVVALRRGDARSTTTLDVDDHPLVSAVLSPNWVAWRALSRQGVCCR